VRGGERENLLVKIAWIRACVKLDCWISKNASQDECETMVIACLVLLVLAIRTAE